MQVTAGSIFESFTSIIDSPKQVCTSSCNTLLSVHTATLLRTVSEHYSVGSAAARYFIARIEYFRLIIMYSAVTERDHIDAALA
jgi:hypothetical protein